MMFQSKSIGFTLVELLVVMTIVSVSIGLVGGLAVNGFTKYHARAEVLTIERLIKRANISAFATEQRHTLLFEDNSAVLRTDTRELFSKTFEYLRFPAENIEFNSKGIPNKTSISVTASGKVKHMALVSWK